MLSPVMIVELEFRIYSFHLFFAGKQMPVFIKNHLLPCSLVATDVKARLEMEG